MELKVEARSGDLRKGWQEKINEEKEKIIRHYPGFVHHLRVSIDETSHHKEGGFEVKLVASVPSDTVVVTRKGGVVRPLLVEAFDVLAQQFKEILRKKRKSQKSVEVSADGSQYGVIRKLSPYESYGFIVTPDEREIYFHENALKGVDLEALAEGDAVMYGETRGDKGPQASWVRVAR